MNSVTDRTNGFLDAIEGKGFNIVAQQDAEGQSEVSMVLQRIFLQAHGDGLPFSEATDPTALGALAAANAAVSSTVQGFTAWTALLTSRQRWLPGNP